MNFFRLLLVLALMPLTVCSGMPHVACRCSNGEVHYSCPRLGQSKTATTDSVSDRYSAKSPAKKSCCCGAKAAACPASNGGSSDPVAGCCATGCHCTPVFLQAEVGPSLKKVCVPELTQIDLAAIPLLVNGNFQVACADEIVIDTGHRVPIDLVILYERFLI